MIRAFMLALAGILVLGPTAFTGDAAQALLPRGESETNPVIPVAAGLALGGLCIAVPLIAIVGLTIWSRIRRVPASVGIVLGFRSISVPLASLLLLLYAAAAVIAARADLRARQELAALVRNEGAYTARLAGVEWPRVPE